MTETTAEESVFVISFELILIIDLVFVILGGITDLLIAYVILRVRSSRTPQNIFLASWMLADVVNVSAKMCYISLTDSTKLEMTMGALYYACGVMCNLAVIVIVADWYCANYFTAYSEALRKRYRLVIAVVVAVPSIIFIDGALSAVIYKESSKMAHLLILGLMLVCAVFTIAAQCFGACGSAKTSDGYILVATALYTIPMVVRRGIYVAFETFFDDFANLEMVLFLFQYCAPIRNGIIMWKHKEVCDGMKRLVRCSGVGEESDKCDDFHKGFVNPAYVVYSNAENGVAQ